MPTDTELVRVELRELRRDQAVACDALRGAGVETRDATTSGSSSIVTRLGSPIALDRGASSTEPLHVTSTAAPGSDNAPVVEAVDASGEALKQALWFGFGLLACFMVVPTLLARFLP